MKGFDRDYQRRRVVFLLIRLAQAVLFEPRSWATQAGRARSRIDARDPLLSQRIDSPFIDNIVLEAYISSSDFPWTRDHQVFGKVVFPATAYLEMILASAREALGLQRFSIRDMDIREALVLDEGETRKVQVSIAKGQGEGESGFQLASLVFDGPDGEPKWKTHAAGKIRVADAL